MMKDVGAIVAIALICLLATLLAWSINKAHDEAKKSQYWEAMAKSYADKCDAHDQYYADTEKLLDELSMNYHLYDFDFNVLLTSVFGNSYMDSKFKVDSICYNQIDRE